MTWQEVKEAYDAAAGAPVLVRYHGGLRPEDGVISSINATYVFVKFIDGVKACYPRDLTLGT